MSTTPTPTCSQRSLLFFQDRKCHLSGLIPLLLVFSNPQANSPQWLLQTFSFLPIPPIRFQMGGLVSCFSENIKVIRHPAHSPSMIFTIFSSTSFSLHSSSLIRNTKFIISKPKWSPFSLHLGFKHWRHPQSRLLLHNCIPPMTKPCGFSLRSSPETCWIASHRICLQSWPGRPPPHAWPIRAVRLRSAKRHAVQTPGAMWRPGFLRVACPCGFAPCLTTPGPKAIGAANCPETYRPCGKDKECSGGSRAGRPLLSPRSDTYIHNKLAPPATREAGSGALPHAWKGRAIDIWQAGLRKLPDWLSCLGTNLPTCQGHQI